MGKDKAFRWNEWNAQHATSHGCAIEEIERVIRRGSPRHIGNDKLLAVGRGQRDRFVEVIYLIYLIYLIDPDDTIFVIHAMPLTTRRRRRGR